MSAPSTSNVHPLANSWCFWEIANTKDYGTGVRKLGDSFDTIERFWDYQSSILRPSEVFGDGTKKVLVDGREIKALGIFKKDIAPEWEDPANSVGAELDASKPLSMDALDTHWESIIFALIGEMVDVDDSICGARVAVRQKQRSGFKFEIWLRDKNEAKACQIRTKLIDVFNEVQERLKPNFRMSESDFIFERRK